MVKYHFTDKKIFTAKYKEFLEISLKKSNFLINVKSVICQTEINFSSDNYYIYVEIDDF